MSTWKSVKLGDVVKFNPDSIKKGYPHKIIEYLDIASVGSNVSHGTQTYIRATAPGRAKRLVCDGDTIFSTVRPNLKTYLKIVNPPDNLVVSTGFAVLRPTDAIDKNFLFYAVTNQPIINELSAIADSKTTSYPAVTADDIANIEIYMPVKDTQTKIGVLLSAYDNLIENNNRRIAILEEMAQQLYREWFVHFRFPGHEDVKMVESELGLIPEGWIAGTVGDVCVRIFSGGTPTTSIDEYWNGDFPWLSSGETNESFITKTDKTITEIGINNSSTRQAEKFDVVVASAGQGKTRGQTSILLLDTYINQSVIALKAKENFHSYLFFNIRNRYDELRHISDSSSIRGSLTTAIFHALPILIPDGEIIGKFNDMTMTLIKQIEDLSKKNTTLRKTCDHLLPRLISGDIDVSDLPIQTKED